MSSVLIIGAGLAGLTSARVLQERGYEVMVLDQHAAAAEGTSFANAGMLTPSMADPWNAPGLLHHLLGSLGHEESSFLLRLGALPSTLGWAARFLAFSHRGHYLAACRANFALAQLSLQQLDSWQRELGLQFDQLGNGTMKLFANAGEADVALAVAEELSPLGLKVRRLSAAEAVAHEPVLAATEGRIAEALLYPDDGSGNARQFCIQLAERIQADGGVIHYQQAVKRWAWRRGLLVGVETQGQRFEADYVVLAAGCDSTALLKPLGLDLMVKPVKGYSITLTADSATQIPALPLIDEALHCAMTPLGRQLRVAGTAEIAGYDLAKRPARIENLKHMVQTLLPQSAPQLLQGDLQPWAGLRPMSADGMPYIGRPHSAKPLSRLYLNTGHGHLGWTHTAGSALLLADAIAGVVSSRTEGFDAQPFSARRVLRRG